MDPFQCYDEQFWVGGLLQAGMLFRTADKWFLALGTTPALVHAAGPHIAASSRLCKCSGPDPLLVCG